MISIYKKTEHETLHELPSFEGGSWVYAEHPDETEMDRLAKEFSLEKGLLSDAIDPYEVPRVEVENGVIYIFLRFAQGEGNKIATAPFMIAMNGDFFVSVLRGRAPFITKFLEEKIEFVTTQKTKFFLRILAEITATYNSALAQIHRKVRGTSVNMGRISNADIIQFVTFENILNDFNSSLAPMNDSLNGIIHDKMLPFGREERDLLKDIILSNDQLIKTCTTNIKMIANIRGAYSTIMTNNLNHVIKLFTAVTVALTPSVIISSLYGMNVMLPFMDSPFAFLIIIAIIVTISVFIFGIFIAKRWL